MFLLRLCLFVCVNLFLYTNCTIPVEKLCVNTACNEVISVAQGKVLYQASMEGALGFHRGQEIQVTSKSKKAGDYWGVIIDGKKGFAPPHLLKEVRILHKNEDLIPVSVEETQQQAEISPEGLSKSNTLNQIPSGSDATKNSGLPQVSEPVLDALNKVENSSPIEKSVNPSKTFSVIEGTTIYADERDEITPSATLDVKTTHYSDAPATNKLNKEVPRQQERATIPPEVIKLNSNYKASIIGEKNNLTIDTMKENDEHLTVESKNILTDEEDEEGDDDHDEHDEDEEDDNAEEEEEEGSESAVENQHSQSNGNKESQNIKKVEKVVTNNLVEGMTQARPKPVLPGDLEDLPETVVNAVEDLDTSHSGIGVASAEQQPNTDINKVKMSTPETPDGLRSNGNYPSANKNLNVPLMQRAESLNMKYANPQTIIPTLSKVPSAQAEIKVFASASTALPGSVTGHDKAEPLLQQMTPETAPITSQDPEAYAEQISDIVTPKVTTEKTNQVFTTNPQPVFSESSTISHHFSVSADAVPEDPNKNDEKPPAPEFFQEKLEVMTGDSTMPRQQEAAEAAGQDSVIQEASNFVTSKNGQEVEVANEASVTPSVPEVLTEASATPPSSPEALTEASVTPPSIPEALTENSVTPPSIPEVLAETSVTSFPEVLTEDSVTEESFSEESKLTEKAKISEVEESNTLPEKVVEEQGMLSQITEMVSSWFKPSPGESPGEVTYEAQETYENIASSAKSDQKSIESSTEAPLGTCPNSDLGLDCTEFPSATEQATPWSIWIPANLTLDGILRQSNTFVYLVITAITVLLFTLGHNLIEKRGKTGPLIAKINKLEQELLVSSKECLLLKDEVQSARDKIILYENNANDELVVSLQVELEESKKIRSDLESSIEVLQQELDAATEAGLDLNKMLSEVLTQKGGSESLLKSVESLQAQLDSQQKVIDEMTKKLGVKNQENEALQMSLEAANEKSENLEEQLTDIKHNLNLHLKEKEDLTRDLNSQITQLKARINQLGETKEKEILKLKKEVEALQKKFSDTSGELTVKEGEVKELKESMKNLKTKGNVKLENVFDVSRVKAELAKERNENQRLLEKLQKEENHQKTLTEQVKVFDGEMQKLKKEYEEAEQKKEEAEKKLEVLSTYFKEKETQLQKELGLQEALWAQKKGDEKTVYNMMKSLQEEVERYKSQNETLKKEILDQERGLKTQMAGLEQKAHENWVAARQAERKLEESKQEMAQLRNRLTLMEKNSSNVEGNLRSSEELNGVEAASPILHETSSPLLFPPLPLDPGNSSLLPPGFMPPPMFMPPPIGGFMPPPPFLPGDRRPPPLGRMSSPPLNNRFSPSSPADYPFERMSSPPLSPPCNNYRSNEDREHYRHRTPPFPPPLHPRNWDDSNEMPGFIPISSQRDSRRDHKGSNVSSEYSSSESLDKSSRHSGRV